MFPLGQFLFITIFPICVRYIVCFLLSLFVYSFVLNTSLLFTPLVWTCYLIIQYKVYVACIIYTNCASLLIVHFIEYLARMSDLSEVIDKLDDDGVLHSTDSTADFGSGAVGAASPVASSIWVPFTGSF